MKILQYICLHIENSISQISYYNGYLYFPVPGPLLGPQHWPWPQICIYRLWPPICIYRSWHPICIYQPWYQICIYQPLPPICIYRPWPQCVLTDPGQKQFIYRPWSLKCIYHPRPQLLPRVCIYQSRSRLYCYHSY